MTNEEIKQSAEAYADKLLEIRGELEWCATRDDFIAGAHSRDEEIKHLTRIANTYKVDAQDTAAECERLHDIIDQLRNPCISVEERLPEEDKDNNGYSVKVIGMFDNGCIADCFCSLEENIWFIDNLTCDKPTYWMPIPKIKKGK